jgi:hypothetical protein
MVIWIFSTIGKSEPTLWNTVSNLIYFRTYKLGEEGVFLFVTRSDTSAHFLQY